MTLSQLRPALVALMIAASAAGAMAQAARKGAGSLLPGSNSKEPVNIEAQKLDYYGRDQKLVYTGNVVAVQGDLGVERGALVRRQGSPLCERLVPIRL